MGIKTRSPHKSNLILIGEKGHAGTYLLRIRLAEDTEIRFGRFKKGYPIFLPAGDYVYVGSALAEKGATSLARRLVRHATRSANLPPHAIRCEMIRRFTECGLGIGNLIPRRGKTLHWHIDFLLQLQSAEIVNVIVLRSPERLENRIAERLEQDSDTQIIERNLGANDAPGSTHLLRVNAGNTWWEFLAAQLTQDNGNNYDAKKQP